MNTSPEETKLIMITLETLVFVHLLIEDPDNHHQTLLGEMVLLILDYLMLLVIDIVIELMCIFLDYLLKNLVYKEEAIQTPGSQILMNIWIVHLLTQLEIVVQNPHLVIAVIILVLVLVVNPVVPVEGGRRNKGNPENPTLLELVVDVVKIVINLVPPLVVLIQMPHLKFLD